MAWIALLLFAGSVAMLQWLGGGHVTWLPAQTVLAFAVLRLAGRLVPWQRWAVRQWPNGAAMYFLFVRHFIRIAGEEAVTTLRAWRIAAPRITKPAGFSSLGYAAAAVFTRSITRAERFYSGLRVQGICE